MKATKRPILTLKNRGLVDPEDDRALELGVYDVLLPCRQFVVSYKVAELGRVSLTAEFLLRLLRSVDGMKEADVAGFFGYDQREMSFVLSEVEKNDFVNRRDGRLFLTPVGQGLFRDGSEYPEIFEVDTLSERVGFDLIALAPENRKFLSPFELQLPELRAQDDKKVSEATSLIPSAFRRFYGEITSYRNPTTTIKRSLYSIDNVVAKNRFSNTVRISLQSTGLRPSVAEPDLSDWRPDHEHEDRTEILEAASRFVDDLTVHSQPNNSDIYQILLDLAPDFLKNFTRRNGFAVERYYREAFVRAGDVRSDRPTVPLLGSLFARENTRRLFDVIGYGLRTAVRLPALCIWFPPQTPHWGATKVLLEILEWIKSHALASSDEDVQGDNSRTIGMVAGYIPKHLEKAFDVVGTSNAPRIPSSLEILLIPNILTAVTVHAPIGLKSGLPVPLGFVSFDAKVIVRTQNFVLNHIEDYMLAEDLNKDIRSAVSIDIKDLTKE